MDLALRPMSTSQVLDRTFYLYRNNFVLFAGIAMIAPALNLLAGLVELWIFGPPATPRMNAADPAMLSAFALQTFFRSAIQGLVSLIVYGIGTAVAAGATIHAVSMVHLGKETSIAESYARIMPIFWKILRLVLTILVIALWPLFLVQGLAIGIVFTQQFLRGDTSLAVVLLFAALLLLFGALGSIVWLFYALCRYSLAVPACVLENLGPRQARIRGKFLIKNGMGRIFAVYLLTALMGFVLVTILQLPGYISGNIFTLKPEGIHISALTMVWLFTAEFVGRTIAGPIVTIALALLYYDQRIRKEAFDLQLMMETMTQQSQQPPAAVAVPPAIG